MPSSPKSSSVMSHKRGGLLQSKGGDHKDVTCHFVLTTAPEVAPRATFYWEQRVTGTIVFILTGISVFLAPILKYIPLPVLYGVFLYMGVASLNGIQFWDRCKLFLMPAKHQPDHAFLRHVPLRRIHLFTLVQILCLAVLWILKSTVAAIIFPVMILGLIIVRKLLDLIFSQHDLAWIDNILPEKEKKEADKKKKRRKGAQEDSDEEEGKKLRIPIHVFFIDDLDDLQRKKIFQLELLTLILPSVIQNSTEGNNPAVGSLGVCITLHFKISCPASPAFNYAQSPVFMVPQVKIEMESDCDFTDVDRFARDADGETTL
ncbi:hypothetical protein CB1_000252026 [Camelus ferus]|nr:hypothetical protein CB1_000252026 [Camelus ferus]